MLGKGGDLRSKNSGDAEVLTRKGWLNLSEREDRRQMFSHSESDQQSQDQISGNDVQF